MDMELTLDINSELYPLEATDTFTLVLSKSLSPDADPSSNGAMMTNADSLADDYDYVMHGKVYKYDDAAGSNV